MTQEEKDLLIQDLCGRLPYGVNIEIGVTLFKREITNHRLERIDFNERTINGFYIDSTSIKPYLRPMSDMTRDEEDLYCRYIDTQRCLGTPILTDLLDWLNAHHIDYRQLIEQGLALEAPEDMYYI